jgi:cyclohexanone monooxygenase
MDRNAEGDLRTAKENTLEQCDIVIIGAGFSGMYAVHHMSKKYNVICFEAGDGVGGTWYWNRYPGARVDVESVQYSYGFDDELQQDWQWPEYFSAQPDLERYVNHVADRFGLRQYIRLSNPVVSMRFDDAANRWHVHGSKGDHVVCRFVVSATGALYAKYLPNWPGIEQYQGRILHTTEWPREGIDFTGKHVGLVGTGSTGIQLAPILAEEAEELYIFQRTPAYSIPSGNRPMDPEYEQMWKANYAERRELARETWAGALIENTSTTSIHDVTAQERERLLEAAWHSRNAFQLLLSFPDIMSEQSANAYVSDFAHRKIKGIVKDPEVAAKLCPTTYPLGAKRLCVDNGYYQIFNRDNVTLVDVKDKPIIAFTSAGLRTADADYDLDVIVMATGFDAITGSLSRIDVTGLGGVKLADRWKDGPATYLGSMISGFPNFFMIHGPLTPAAQAQMIATGEWQVNWVTSIIEDIERDGFSRIDTTREAEERWADEVEEISHYTIHRLADSWYNGANIEGKAKKFMVYLGGFPRFRQSCVDAVAHDYAGFTRS